MADCSTELKGHPCRFQKMKSLLGAKKFVLVCGLNLGPLPMHSGCSNDRANQEGSKLFLKQEETFLSAKSMWIPSKLCARIDRLSIFPLATAMPPCWSYLDQQQRSALSYSWLPKLSKMSSRQMHYLIDLTVDMPESRLSFSFWIREAQLNSLLWNPAWFTDCAKDLLFQRSSVSHSFTANAAT